MIRIRMTCFLLICFTFLFKSSPLLSADNPVKTKPLALNKGGVVMTFDDRNFDDWVKALPLLEEFGVRATFFIHGNIDKKALDAIKKLRNKNHAIGSHTVHHLKAVEYLQKRSRKEYLENEIDPQLAKFKANGINVSSLAYPMSRNNKTTDELLLNQFRHIRTGRGIAKGKKFSEDDIFFVPVKEISKHGCLYGKGIDYAPNRPDRTYEQIDAALERAARNKEILVLYAHRIASSVKGNHVTPEALIRIFSKAKELELNFYTFDDLP